VCVQLQARLSRVQVLAANGEAASDSRDSVHDSDSDSDADSGDDKSQQVGPKSHMSLLDQHSKLKLEALGNLLVHFKIMFIPTFLSRKPTDVETGHFSQLVTVSSKLVLYRLSSIIEVQLCCVSCQSAANCIISCMVSLAHPSGSGACPVGVTSGPTTDCCDQL